jgi:hypothetical protein
MVLFLFFLVFSVRVPRRWCLRVRSFQIPEAVVDWGPVCALLTLVALLVGKVRLCGFPFFLKYVYVKQCFFLQHRFMLRFNFFDPA